MGTAEFLYTKNVKEIYYQNLNYIPAGTQPDGRTTYKKLDSTLNDVMLLTNIGKGTSWQMAFKVERPFRGGFYASGSYLYGESKSVNDGTSSVARSNWTGAPTGIDVNNPPLTTLQLQPGTPRELRGDRADPDVREAVEPACRSTTTARTGGRTRSGSAATPTATA